MKDYNEFITEKHFPNAPYVDSMEDLVYDPNLYQKAVDTIKKINKSDEPMYIIDSNQRVYFLRWRYTEQHEYIISEIRCETDDEWFSVFRIIGAMNNIKVIEI